MGRKVKISLLVVLLVLLIGLPGCDTISEAVGRAVEKMDNDWFERTHYRTVDIADYGKYVGNNDNKFAEEIICAFFPAEIEDYFADVRYVYSAVKIDSAAFEAYLEFVIEDPGEFSAYIQQATDNAQVVPFLYDESYMEYTISDYWELGDLYCFQNTCGEFEAGAEYYNIQGAKIQKILFSPTEQRIIYVAIGLYDGGGAGTYYFSTFFDRFGIDPKEYEEHLQEVSESGN